VDTAPLTIADLELGPQSLNLFDERFSELTRPVSDGSVAASIVEVLGDLSKRAPAAARSFEVFVQHYRSQPFQAIRKILCVLAYPSVGDEKPCLSSAVGRSFDVFQDALYVARNQVTVS